MKNPKLIWLAVIATLLGSLLAVPTVTGAQESLTETFTWTAYPVTVRYPAGWAVYSGPTRASLYPADRDVTDGGGPEMVLFLQPGTTAAQIDSAAVALRNSVIGSASPVAAGQIAGYETRSFEFTQTAPIAGQGRLILIALDAQTVVGVATIVRSGDVTIFQPVLDSMVASLTLGAPALPTLNFSSVSAASVQLPQVYAWRAVGLTFAFPQDWTVNTSVADQITATAAQVTSADEGTRTIGIYRIERQAGQINLRTVMQNVLRDSAPDAALVDVTIGGMTGIAARYSDSSAQPAITLQTVLLDVADHKSLALIVMGSTESDWPNFRPIANAFMGSIAPLASGISAESGLRLVSAPVSASTGPSAARVAAPPRQATTQSYLWEEMGINLEVPADWQILPASQDYDLALVSPLAMQGGNGGFVTFRAITFLDQALADAMGPVAESVNGKVEAYSTAGVEGVRVVANNEEQGVEQWLVLLPYDNNGQVLYIQGVTPPADVSQLDTIFNSMEITPLKADADAINAAWQASLAENGTLVYGDPEAPIHLVEYMSFTCGHCANYTAQIERLIALEAEESGRMRFELAPVMWDDYAARASSALYCAVEQGQGYTAYKALYHGYFVDGYDVAYTDDGLAAIMQGLGLDMDAYATCISEKRYSPTMSAVETRFRDAGISATPTLAIGLNGAEPAAIPVGDGQIWSGIIPLSTVREIFTLLIDEGVPLSELMNQ